MRSAEFDHGYQPLFSTKKSDLAVGLWFLSIKATSIVQINLVMRERDTKTLGLHIMNLHLT